jgi:muramoyltetrapeptide carboxypeptidase
MIIKKISPLRPKDQVVAVAPSSWNEARDVSKVNDLARGFCDRLNAKFVFSVNVYNKGASAYCADTENNRAIKLKESFQSKAIWAYQGGYGSASLLPLLDEAQFQPKDGIFIGFSDLTAIHLYFNQICKLPTIHGMVVSSLLSSNKYIDEYVNYLSGREKRLNWSDVKIIKDSSLESIGGVSAGGNLRVLASLCGTKYQLDSSEKIIFLEDVGEKGYSYDRSFRQLVSSGALKGAKAIVFGDFSLEKTDVSKEIMLKQMSDIVDIPLFSCEYFGHINDNNILNGKAEIIFDSIFHE